MKKNIIGLTAILGIVFSANVFSANVPPGSCGIWQAKISRIYESYDQLVVMFDRETSCLCGYSNRLFYDKNDKNAAFFAAASMAAFTYDKYVDAIAYDRACTNKFGRTARLSQFHIHK